MVIISCSLNFFSDWLLFWNMFYSLKKFHGGRSPQLKKRYWVYFLLRWKLGWKHLVKFFLLLTILIYYLWKFHMYKMYYMMFCFLFWNKFQLILKQNTFLFLITPTLESCSIYMESSWDGCYIKKKSFEWLKLS